MGYAAVLEESGSKNRRKNGYANYNYESLRGMDCCPCGLMRMGINECAGRWLKKEKWWKSTKIMKQELSLLALRALSLPRKAGEANLGSADVIGSCCAGSSFETLILPLLSRCSIKLRTIVKMCECVSSRLPTTRYSPADAGVGGTISAEAFPR